MNSDSRLLCSVCNVTTRERGKICAYDLRENYFKILCYFLRDNGCQAIKHEEPYPRHVVSCKKIDSNYPYPQYRFIICIKLHTLQLLNLKLSQQKLNVTIE